MIDDDPAYKVFVYTVLTFATLGTITLLCFVGLGVWKFVELIS